MNRWVRSGSILTVALISLWILTPVHHLRVEEKATKPAPIQTKATMEEKRENKALIVSYLRALGYDQQQRKCAVSLWTRESRFDHLARPRNSEGKPISSAFGIAQLLRERSRKPELQILHAIRYVEHRYRGNFCDALQHSDRKRWY